MMEYYCARAGQSFGPYSLEVLREYLAQGRLGLDDYVWKEGMLDWVPISRMFGAELPDPPEMDWAAVLSLGVCTLGIFWCVWSIRLARWGRRLNAGSSAVVFANVSAVAVVVAELLAAGSLIANTNPDANRELVRFLIGAGLVLALGALVLQILAAFSIRKSLRGWFASRPLGRLEISASMTLFFTLVYLQYQASRIASWKRTGAWPA